MEGKCGVGFVDVRVASAAMSSGAGGRGSSSRMNVWGVVMMGMVVQLGVVGLLMAI